MEQFAQLTQALGPRTTTSLAVLATYIGFCRGLRYLRRDQRHLASPYKTRDDFKNMTADDALEIVKYVQSVEFPWTSRKALAFALFKTYGIPTISKLLCETQQLGKVEYASRRYVDTSILIIEFMGKHPTSERACSAIARMNWLHGRYQKAGKISNDDMLYTLSLFVLEVPRWVEKFEWRNLTPLEICGIGTHWKNIGDAMNIDLSPLEHGSNNFKDGLEFYEDIKKWALAYENEKMVPDKFNHQLAEETSAILMTNVPKPMKPVAKQFVISLMDNILRKAMLYEAPQAVYPRIIDTIFAIRRTLLRWVFPPRPWSMRYNPVSDRPDPKTGRLFINEYENQPWYVKPTFFARNSPMAWFRWAIGGPYPDGKRYKPEGYKIFEVGPAKLESKGIEECEAMRDSLMASGRGGCPFAFTE